jgi:hypothetical protein
VGTWLRAFTFGHVRQLDQVTGEVLARAWAAGAGPGEGPLVVDVDSTTCEVHAARKTRQKAAAPINRGQPRLPAMEKAGEVLARRIQQRWPDRIGARKTTASSTR